METIIEARFVCFCSFPTESVTVFGAVLSRHWRHQNLRWMWNGPCERHQTIFLSYLRKSYFVQLLSRRWVFINAAKQKLVVRKALKVSLKGGLQAELNSFPLPVKDLSSVRFRIAILSLNLVKLYDSRQTNRTLDIVKRHGMHWSRG